MAMFKCNVTCAIGHVLFALADVRQTLCDVGNGRWLDLDDLDVN